MARQINDQMLRFPINGLHVMTSGWAQPAGTATDLLNVRVFDQLEERARGGLRPGLGRYCSAQTSSGLRVQDINVVVTVVDAAPNTTTLSVRSVKNVLVSNGTISQFTRTAITDATPSGNSALLANAPFILSASLFGKVYFTDGVSYKVWVAANNTTEDFIASAGSLPGTDGTKVPRLVESWQTRLVWAGLRDDPNNWFMSAKGTPTDYDYAATPTTQNIAVTGTIGTVGKMDDIINSIIPYNDDLLIFGGDHSLWLMNGNPAADGQFDQISSNVGTAFGRPWCRDPEGGIYFMSNNAEVYKLEITERGVALRGLSHTTISPLITNTDLNTTFVRMAYNERQHGFHIFLVSVEPTYA